MWVRELDVNKTILEKNGDSRDEMFVVGCTLYGHETNKEIRKLTKYIRCK